MNVLYSADLYTIMNILFSIELTVMKNFYMMFFYIHRWGLNYVLLCLVCICILKMVAILSWPQCVKLQSVSISSWLDGIYFTMPKAEQNVDEQWL